ncbi:MAG: hypothetical protein EPN48_02675 [Microbacteriaceae bacterium]|nr:MAG: hypothetical protein EPN48_02675 [Microbacteriaceae bacterium]
MTATDLFSRLATRTQAWNFFHWYWGDAIAVDGLLLAGEHDQSGAYDRAVRLVRHWATAAPDSDDDVLAPGRAIVELVSRGEVERQAVDRFMMAVDRLPVLTSGMPLLEPHRPLFRFGVCIDALYHLPVAIAAYGRLVEDERRLTAAVQMSISTMDLLRCDGGWAHWYDAARDENNAIPWSRGAGWALLGLLDLLDVIDGIDGAEKIAGLAVEVLDTLAQTQADDGDWPGILGDDHALTETSTAAFFVAGALHPRAREHWQAPDSVLDRAMAAVERSVDESGIAHGVSADMLPEWARLPYQVFRCEPSPWGQGAALRAAAAIRDRVA